MVNDFLAQVLIDTGSTHSFITPGFAQAFSIEPSRLDRGLSITTPVDSSVITDRVYRSCMIRIGQREMPANLVVLEFQDFDIILGMDWLSAYHGHVDYFGKVVNFKLVNEPPFR